MSPVLLRIDVSLLCCSDFAICIVSYESELGGLRNRLLLLGALQFSVLFCYLTALLSVNEIIHIG